MNGFLKLPSLAAVTLFLLCTAVQPDLVPRREVITRLWTRGDDGRWRISHMHVSLDEVLDP